jgi:hypothetical protein
MCAANYDDLNELEWTFLAQNYEDCGILEPEPTNGLSAGWISGK